MARPKQTVRTVYIHVGLPEDLVAQLQLHLFSDVEGKIPMGAQQAFFTKLVREHFAQKEAGNDH